MMLRSERLPSRDVINSIVDELRDISFPGFFGKENMGYVTKKILRAINSRLIYDKLFRQVKIALSYGNREHSYEQIKKSGDQVPRIHSNSGRYPGNADSGCGSRIQW